MAEVQQRLPCSSCPFRSDITFYLSVEKVELILDALLGDDGSTYHNTSAVVDHLLAHRPVLSSTLLFTVRFLYRK